MEINSSNENALRFLMDIRERNQTVRRENGVFERRREYIVGQMVLGAIPELPECIPGTDEDNRKRFVLFERFIRCMSLSKRLHAYLANTLGDTYRTSPKSVKVSAKLAVNLFYKKLDSRVAFTGSASVSMDTTVSEPAIITKTQSRNLERRRQRMVGRILLDYFPEIPPLVKGTNEEYLSQIIAFRYLIQELGALPLTHKMISSCWCVKERR